MPTGMEKFGKVSYTKESKVSDFVKFLEEGKVAATRCKKCGRLSFPPRADCPDCFASDFEWVPLSGKCKLVTYTVAHFAPTGFEDDVPYVLAVAECEEGVKVFTRVSKSVNPSELEVGMELRLVPVKIGEDRYSFELTKP
ncbi:MAG: Zn-ribbon domain-containing OB-fold protein [Candidatus Nezhaarchaeales archaeon]